MLKKELNKGTIHSESMYKREFFPASNDLFKMIIADDGAGMEAGKKTIGIGNAHIKKPAKRFRLAVFQRITRRTPGLVYRACRSITNRTTVRNLRNLKKISVPMEGFTC